MLSSAACPVTLTDNAENVCCELIHYVDLSKSNYLCPKINMYGFATNNCLPPHRETTTDGTAVQVVTPDKPADVTYVFKYSAEKLWLQPIKAAPSVTERTKLNKARREAVHKSVGLYAACKDGDRYNTDLYTRLRSKNWRLDGIFGDAVSHR